MAISNSQKKLKRPAEFSLQRMVNMLDPSPLKGREIMLAFLFQSEGTSGEIIRRYTMAFEEQWALCLIRVLRIKQP